MGTSLSGCLYVVVCIFGDVHFEYQPQTVHHPPTHPLPATLLYPRRQALVIAAEFENTEGGSR